MSKVSRSRVIAADLERVWSLVSDPYGLPRWWPRTRRVEDVRTGPGGKPAWTTVLETERGTGVRADYRCTAIEPQTMLAWEQQIEGTPFDRILRASALEVRLDKAGQGTEVTLVADETLRGLSRLGAPMISGASRKRLEEALDGIEGALVGPTG